VRAKGQSLGVLGLFGATILNYTIEDITLFTTIADQIGGLVERARLVRQAELAAVVQERQRLARELHDSVTQLLYSQVLFSGAGRKELHQGNRSQAESHLARIESAAQQALKEMRLLVYELRPPNDLEEGLAVAIERRLEAVERRTGMVARLIVSGEEKLPPAASLALYRIAEEALNNTLKHASAATVLVALRFNHHEASLEVADDGRGFDHTSRPEGGMGLINMRDRAASLGSRLSIDSAPGQGTRISVTIRLPE
jgi:signal transduction histidine kinase